MSWLFGVVLLELKRQKYSCPIKLTKSGIK